MPDQIDVAQQWQAFTPERRATLLQKMTPGQKKALRAKIEGGSSTAAATDTSTKTPGFRQKLVQQFDAKRQQFDAKRQQADAKVAPGQESEYDFGNQLYEAAKGLAQVGESLVAHPIESLVTGPLKQLRDVMPSYTTVGGVPIPIPNREGAQHTLEQGKQAIEHPAYTTGNLVGQAVLGETVGRVGGGLKGFREAAKNNVRAAAQQVAGAGRAVVTEAVRTAGEKAAANAETTGAKNRKAVEEHQTAIRENAAHNDQANMEHAADTEAAKQEAAAKHAENVAKVQQQDKEALATHAAETQEAQELNRGAEETLNLRRKTEAELKAKTDAYFAKEDAADARVKKETDKVWEPFHEKAKTPVNVDRLAEDLEKINRRNPAAAAELHHITGAAEDAAPDSLYAQDRAAIMKSQGFHGDYWELPADRRANIDAIAASSGFEPDPIDLDPKQGIKISLEDIHRATSIIGDKIAKGGYEGVMLGEMKQVLKALNAARTRGAIELGVLPDLERGVKATREYKEAFGRERPERQTVKGERKSDANAEAVAEREEQARLDAAAKHDPTLVKDQKEVAALRKKLKALPTEEKLRAGLKPLPERPTPGPSPTPPEPKLPAPPKMKERPAAPKLEPIETPTVDIRKVRADAVRSKASRFGLTSYDAAIAGSTMLQPLIHLMGGAGEVFRGAAGTYIISKVMAQRLLENPRVVDWLAQPSAKDLDVIRKMPEAGRVKIVGAITQAASEARAKGLPVSPAVLALGLAPVVNRKDALSRVAPHPGTHVFHIGEWQSHPENRGKDVNAAIAKAKSQGYSVVQ